MFRVTHTAMSRSRLVRIRRRIADGSYETDRRLAETAERLASELMGRGVERESRKGGDLLQVCQGRETTRSAAGRGSRSIAIRLDRAAK